MTKEKISKKIIISIFVFGLFLPIVYVSAATVLSSHKYAWSNNVGYINFESVIVNDDALSGYAWSANKGLIKFNPANGGVFNDGIGNLSGFAWGEQLGWIDFNNVSINGVTGQFSGTATGTLVGTITFDCPNYCDVQTNWRQTIISSSGGGGGRVPPTITNDIISSNISNEVSAAANSLQGVSVTGGNTGSASNLSPVEQPALFDILASPIQSNQGNLLPTIALSILFGTLVSGLILFILNKIKDYKRKENAKEENNIIK